MKPFFRISIQLFTFSFLLFNCNRQIAEERVVIIEEDDEKCIYNIQNEIVNRYLSEVVYKRDDYSYSAMPDYYKVQSDFRKDISKPIYVTWNETIEGSLSYIVCLYEGHNLMKEMRVKDNSVVLQNLTPGKEYLLTVDEQLTSSTKRIFSKVFNVTGPLRMIHVDGYRVGNIRDIGGWSTNDGGYLKYGLIYRGAEIYLEKEGKKKISITDEGIHTLIKDLHVQVELDYGGFSDTSPLEDYGIDFFHGREYGIIAYDKSLDLQRVRQRYRDCLRLIINALEKGKTVFTHCSAGADRTGTLFFILEALVGVNDSDLSKDYELTSFSCLNTPRYRNAPEFVGLISFINEHYSGSTINDKVYTMATLPLTEMGLGMSADEIQRLRELLIEYPSEQE